MTVAVRVIPCLDVDAGRVVKGVNFRDLRDAGDPVELAATYDAEGADELTFLDITASSGERETTYEVVRRTAEQVFIPLTVGGGVRSTGDVDRLLRAGADKVSLNTAAIARPELLGEAARRFGSQCIVLSVDARRAPSAGCASGFEVTTHGGQRGTGIDAVDGPAAVPGSAWRDPAELDGRRRHRGRIRHRAHRGGPGGGARPADRERRRGQYRRLRAGSGGGRRRGAGRDLFHFGKLRSARSRTRCGQPVTPSADVPWPFPGARARGQPARVPLRWYPVDPGCAAIAAPTIPASLNRAAGTIAPGCR